VVRIGFDLVAAKALGRHETGMAEKDFDRAERDPVESRATTRTCGHCRSSQGQNINSLLAARLWKLPHGGTGFDLVLALDVFEDVPDDLGFLAELHTRRARFVFHVPLDPSVRSVLRATPLAEQRRNVGHLHFFTDETALAALETASYRILDARLSDPSLDRPRTELRRRRGARSGGPHASPSAARLPPGSSAVAPSSRSRKSFAV
jgi:hypothetical protein